MPSLRPKKPPKQYPPLGIEREYMIVLRKILERTKDLLEREALQLLPRILEQAKLETRLDTYEDDIAELREGFARATTLTEDMIVAVGEEAVFELAYKASTWNKKAVGRMLRSKFGIIFYDKEPWLSDMLRIFATNNSNLIKSNNMEFINKTQETVYRGMNAGTRHEVIRKELFAQSKTELGRNSVFRNAQHRASVIARDQVNKINGDLTHLRQERVGVKKFIWRTAGDGRVRPLHQSFNGKTYKWNEGASGGLLPGQDIMCRCYAEPVIE